MFRHVVIFKWKPGTSDDTITGIAEGLTKCALALAGTRAYTCGPDVRTGTEGRFDFCVVGDFDDEASWRVYDEDAEHNRLRTEVIRPILAERYIVQFET
jgi:stress responsive alpha/beta barrel protein